ncbi:MAG: DNA-binding protein [Thermodesulfobacteriota bacterium]
MRRLFLPCLLALLPLLLAACGGERYGTGVDPAAPAVKVRDIFLRSDLQGLNVTLEGTISTQCQSNGCWFVLQDDTGQLYIDLSQGNMTLPARTGKRVRASGTVAMAQGSHLLVARGVEVQ